MNSTTILEKLKPFIALAVLIFIIVSSVSLIKYNNLQKDIKDNCGYERQDKVFCVCDKNLVSLVDTGNNPYYIDSELNLVTGKWD